jgi:hypothetical protein
LAPGRTLRLVYKEFGLRLLFVTNSFESYIYEGKWRSKMKYVFVTELDRYSRAVSTIVNYVKAAESLGHEVKIFGEKQDDPSDIEYTLDPEEADFVIFVVYQPSDFPDLPYLARILDRVPRERRVIIDCCGRYNETVRVEHDFNHLEKIDGHQGWEWVEGFQAVSDRILQPTFASRRADAKPFLFHGFDPTGVVNGVNSPVKAAAAWTSPIGESRPYGVVYVGNNWQRWSQVQPLLKSIASDRESIGPICFVGWDWNERPDWAIELGIRGADVDPALMEQLEVEIRPAIPFDEVSQFASRGRFCPIIHRPLFRELQFVTNRTFETFCADTVPLILIDPEMAVRVYGPSAEQLIPEDDVVTHMKRVLADPEPAWEAVHRIRLHLAKHHSYKNRFEELIDLLQA